MIKTVIWFSVSDGGDGSAYPRWFLTEEDARTHQEKQNEDGEGFTETCIGSIETFEGSDCHRDATINSKDLNENND